jgi:hypothetical protein
MKKLKALNVGLKILERYATSVKADDGAILVGIGQYGEVFPEEATTLKDNGWFVDLATGKWCFCV